MRTDVRIGIAVGLLAIALVVGYLLMAGPTDRLSQDQLAQKPEAAEETFNRVEREPARPPAVPMPVVPGYVGEPVRPSMGRTTEHEPAMPAAPLARAPVVVPTPAPVPGVIPTPAPSEPVEPVRPRQAVAPVEPRPRDAVPLLIEPVVTPVTPPYREPSRPVTPAPGPQADETYVVEKGDAGFWAIAVKKYGEGRHWNLIAKANPNADSSGLRPGQKLVIPPLPKAPEPAPSPAPVAEQVLGKKVYVVKAGDTIWNIAEQEYGHGKHWKLIAEANPSIDSVFLTIGQKLLLPPRPAEPAPAAIVAERVPAGQRVHMVTPGEAGLWDIAAKEYGHGKHWQIIADANPNVDSRMLRIGQKLVIPPLPEEAQKTGRLPAETSTVRRTRPAAPASDDRPYFD